MSSFPVRFYAHSRENVPVEGWQLLSAHLLNVSGFASVFASLFGASSWARVIGLLHDAGKVSPEFLRYLLAQNGLLGEVNRDAGKVVHSTLGAQVAVRLFGDLVGRDVAYAIAGHHGGLPDWSECADSGTGMRSCLRNRIEPEVDESALQTVLGQCGELAVLQLPGWLSASGRNETQTAFRRACFIRMLFSCLVDADRLDTESFMSPERYEARCRLSAVSSLGELKERLERHMEKFSSSTGGVNDRRREVLQACIKAAPLERGFFSLTVPTGGGKTLASLRFALDHAASRGLRRAIYVIPFTSIIEQTADVFRGAVGDPAVLEHHSNFDPKVRRKEEAIPEEDSEESLRYEFLSQNWDAPIVVTTGVQFYESLFAAQASRCRKLHNIAGSVIILDEAQTLPPELLGPCLDALRELVRGYGCSVVFCTATQPALTKAAYFPIGFGENEVRSIIRNPAALYDALQRVRVEQLEKAISSEALADQLASESRVLCVVNTRKHVSRLYDMLKSKGDDGGDQGIFHLSALMCPEHRSEVIRRIRDQLKTPELPCRVVSTQLVEAGVDLDFPVLYRAMAGLDSIAQAAGRCNREGLLRDENGNLCKGRVVIFEPVGKERDFQPFGFIKTGAQHAKSVFRRFKADPLSLDGVRDYFERYYQEFNRSGENWDKPGVLSGETLSISSNGALMAQFRLMAERFKFISDGGETVVVPYGKDGRALCERLRDEDLPLRHEDFRSAQRFSVSVREKDFMWLLSEGAVLQFREGRFNVLMNDAAYDKEKGLDVDAGGILDAEKTQC